MRSRLPVPEVILHNRLASVMVHIPWLSGDGKGRLATEAGVDPSVISRLIGGHRNPSYIVAARIGGALERRLGKSLDLRELFSESGIYPTKFVCQLTGCPGCLPGLAFSKEGDLKRKFRTMQPGSWTGDNQEFQDLDLEPIEELR